MSETAWAPRDDIEREALVVENTKDYCRDSLPPDHHECTRVNGHANDHVAVCDGLVIARWDDATWERTYAALAAKAWNFDPAYADPTVNMYGFTACPKCKGKCRYSMIATPTVAQCDDCDFREPIKAKPAL